MTYRFIIRGRNCRKYATICLASVMNQKLTNWHAHIVLDQPEDGSDKLVADIIKSSPLGEKFSLVVNSERKGLARNIYEFPKTLNADPEDVFCFVDADDWITTDALEAVNKKYSKENILITHGSYIKVSKSRTTRISKKYPKGANVRTHPWRGSHLKTVKAKLFDRLPEHCMKMDNGDWLPAASDLAIMIPLMELAGLKRVAHVKTPIYYWRDKTEHTTNREMQKQCEKIIRAKTPLAKLNDV